MMSSKLRSRCTVHVLPAAGYMEDIAQSHWLDAPYRMHMYSVIANIKMPPWTLLSAEKGKYTSGCDVWSPVDSEHYTLDTVASRWSVVCSAWAVLASAPFASKCLTAESAKKMQIKFKTPSPNPNGKNMRMYGWSPCCLKKKVKTK